MNKQQFLFQLKRALSVLPDKEQEQVMRYYEDYFLDAEGQTEEQIVKTLGSPEQIAQEILRDFQELQPRPGTYNRASAHSADTQNQRKNKKKLGLASILIIILLVIVVGIPVFSVLFAIILSILAVLIGILLAIFCIPFAVFASGIGLSFISLFLWWQPASALLTFGAGLVCLAIGGLLILGLYKLLKRFFPPAFRGLIDILRKGCQKIGGLFQ